MIRLKSGNILLTSARDIIEYGHWDSSLEWFGQMKVDNPYNKNHKRIDLLSMRRVNEYYNKHWHDALRAGTLRFFVKEPTEEDLNYPWVNSSLAKIIKMR